MHVLYVSCVALPASAPMSIGGRLLVVAICEKCAVKLPALFYLNGMCYMSGASSLCSDENCGAELRLVGIELLLGLGSSDRG